MKYKIYIYDKAQDDINKIYDRYKKESLKAHKRFKENLYRSFDLITYSPKIMRQWDNGFRIAYIKKFPHEIIYDIFGDTIAIIGVMHGNQDMDEFLEDRY